MATSGVRPYLTRNDLYTLSWACYPVVCILFVAFHLKLATNSVGDGVEDAKRALATSCNAAQKAATVAVSLPRYLAQGGCRDFLIGVSGQTMDKESMPFWEQRRRRGAAVADYVENWN